MKNNAELGRQVNTHLTSLGINTPTTDLLYVGRDEKVEKIKGHMKAILETLGLDLTDDSLEETPIRVAKMFVDEIYSGLTPDTFPKCTTVENKFANHNEFVMERDITLFSDCEHHLRTIHGVAHVAYVPTDKVLGLSKLNRIVQYFGQRPQVQERLTQQIAHAIQFITGSDHVCVAIDAKHMCVSQRGIKDSKSSTVTLAALGKFGEADSNLRREFMAATKQ